MAKEIEKIKDGLDYIEERQLTNAGTHFLLIIGSVLLVGLPVWVLYKFGFFTNYFEIFDTERTLVTAGITISILLVWRSYIKISAQLRHRHHEMWEARDQLENVVNRHQEVTQQFRTLSDNFSKTKTRHYFELIETNEVLQGAMQANLADTLQRVAKKGSSVLQANKFSVWFFNGNGSLNNQTNYDAFAKKHKEVSVSPEMVQLTKLLQDPTRVMPASSEVQALKNNTFSYKSKYLNALAIPIVGVENNLVGMCWAEASVKEEWGERKQQLGIQLSNIIATAMARNEREIARQEELELLASAHEKQAEDLTENYEKTIARQEQLHRVMIEKLNEKFSEVKGGLERDIAEKSERIDRLFLARSRYRTLVKEANFGVARFKLQEAVATENAEEAALQLLENAFLTILNPMGEEVLQLESNAVEGKPLGVLIEYPQLPSFVKTFIQDGFEPKEATWGFENERGEMQHIQLTLFATLDDALLSGIWLVLNDLTPLHLRAKRFKSIFDNTQQMVTVMDKDFHILYENAALTNLLGYHDRTGKTFTSFLHPDDFERVDQVLSAMVRGEETKKSLLSVRHITENETWVNIDLQLHNLLENSEVRAIILEATDNTERAKYEQTLQSETDFYKMLIENKDEVITVVDHNGFVQYENAAMQRLFGYDPGMRIGSYGLEYVHTEDVEDLDKFFQKTKNSVDVTLEKHVQFMDVRGNWRDVLVSMRKLDEAKNGEGELMLTLKDIGRQEAEKRKEQEQQKLFRALIQQSACVYLVTNRFGKVLFASDSIREILGLNPKELLNKELSKLVGDDYATMARDIVRDLNADPHTSVYKEMKFRNTHREWRNVKMHASALHFKGSPLGLMFQLEDITDQLREQSELSFRSRFYRSLVNAASYYLIFTDFNQNIKYVNPAAKQQLGYQLKGKLTDWLHSEDKENIEAEWGKVVEHQDYQLESTIRLMNKEGNWEYFILKAQNGLNTTSFKGVLIECRVLDKKAVEQADRSVDKQVGQALQATKSITWGLLNNRQQLIASSESFYTQWAGNAENEGLQSELQEGNLRNRFQRMVRREGDTHEVLTLNSGNHLEVGVSTTQKGVMIFAEKQPLEIREYPQLVVKERNQRLMLEELPIGIALMNKAGEVLSMNTKVNELLGIADNVHLHENNHHFVKPTDYQHFTSIIAEARLHPERICEGKYLMSLAGNEWKEVNVFVKSLSVDSRSDHYILWVEESKSNEGENIVTQPETKAITSDTELISERDRWREVALQEVDKQRELNNQLWVYRRQALEQQTRSHFGEVSFGAVNQAKEELQKATFAWEQMKQYYHDLRSLLEEYLGISTETNIFLKLEEIRMLKNEIDFESLFPNMNAQVEAIQKRIESSEKQLNTLLGLQNGDISEKTDFKPCDLFTDIKETFKNHPQSKVYFWVAEDDGDIVTGPYFRLHQLICAFVHAVQDVFTIEEVKLLDGRNEEHAYLEVIIDVYEEGIPSTTDWFNDAKSAESLNVWIAKSLMQPYDGNIYIETVKGNQINIAIGLA